MQILKYVFQNNTISENTHKWKNVFETERTVYCGREANGEVGDTTSLRKPTWPAASQGPREPWFPSAVAQQRNAFGGGTGCWEMKEKHLGKKTN